MADVPLSRVPIEIGLKSLDGVNRFEIRLSPDDLGRVHVRLDIDAEGQVKAHLSADRPETLSFLHRDRAHLERAFEQAGLKAADGGLAFSLRDGAADGSGRGGAQADRQPPPETRRAVPEPDGAAVPLPGPVAGRIPSRASPTGIDLRI